MCKKQKLKENIRNNSNNSENVLYTRRTREAYCCCFIAKAQRQQQQEQQHLFHDMWVEQNMSTMATELGWCSYRSEYGRTNIT